MLALVSGRLDLDPASELFHGGGERTVVVTSAAADPRRAIRLAEVADVLVAGDEQVDLPAALDELAGAAWAGCSARAGRRCSPTWSAAGRLDELCLTVAPQLVAGDGPRILAGPSSTSGSRWVTCWSRTACCSPATSPADPRDREAQTTSGTCRGSRA